MKKSFLLLPLASLVLAACSSTESSAPAETESAATSSAYDLQTEVQSTAMPSSMSGGTSTTYSQPQPVSAQPQPVAQPSYNQPSYSQSASSASGEFSVPRDSAGKPIYSQIAKGSYTGSSYTVQQGDTMYLVGYISGKGADEIARLNNLTAPYQLRVGQTLRLQ